MDFIGNQKTVNFLSKSLERGKLNHAYIFSGPENVGKHTLAKMFTLHAIDGSRLDEDTQKFSKDAAFDVIEIAPETLEKNGVSKQRDIPIESIRDAKQNLSLFPYHGKYKVLIIDDAHRMNTAAQNALLKILEEPNETTMIILVTNEIGRILPTVQSRCQKVNFSLIESREMQKHFSEEVVDLSAGRPGLANLISEDETEFSFRKETKEELGKIMAGSLNDRFAMAEEFSKDIVKTLKKLDIWMWELRNIAALSDEKKRNQTYQSLEKIESSIETLKRTNANGRLVLETLFMDM